MRKVTPDTAAHVLSDAAAVLALVESGEQTLDEALDFSLAHPELRRTVSSLLFAYFRHKRLIDGWLAGLAARSPRPRIRRLLAAAMTQIRFQSGIAPESAVNVAVELVKTRGGRGEAGFVNALLRRAVAAPPAIPETPEERPAVSFCRERRRFVCWWRRSCHCRESWRYCRMRPHTMRPAHPAAWTGRGRLMPWAARRPAGFVRFAHEGQMGRYGALRPRAYGVCVV